MSQALLFLTQGFEEIEALATVDILRRGNVNVVVISLDDKKTVTGSHKISVIADALFSELSAADFAAADMLIIPGGTTHFNEHAGLKELVQSFHEAGKYLAAICAAPMVLGGLGLLAGRKATCYPGFEQYLTDAHLAQGEAVVVDGKIITGRGPGLAMDFALQLLAILTNQATRDEVASGLLLK